MGSSDPDGRVEETLTRAHECFERREWRDAFTGLSSVDPGSLAIEDLERLAVAGYLTGNDEPSDDAWMRAHERCLGDDDPVRAARCAFWLGFNLLLRGDMAGSGGWLGRARTLLEDGRHDCAVQGLLLVVEALEHVDRGDGRAAYTLFERAGVIGERFGDRD